MTGVAFAMSLHVVSVFLSLLVTGQCATKIKTLVRSETGSDAVLGGDKLAHLLQDSLDDAAKLSKRPKNFDVSSAALEVAGTTASAPKSFKKFKGQQCEGTVIDVKRDFKGDATACEKECLKMETCVGFVRVNSGSEYANKCFFRGGYILAPTSYTADVRDCYVRVDKATAIAINYGPANVKVDGWQKDNGVKYAEVGDTAFGWKCKCETRDRKVAGKSNWENTNVVPDRDGSCPDNNWEIKLLNHKYKVQVVIGDTKYTQHTKQCTMEGNKFGKGVAVAGGSEEVFQFDVALTDGKLTLGASLKKGCTSVNRIFIMGPPQLSKQDHKKFKEGATKLDSNGDGTITKAEATEAGLTDEQFAALDVNKDGKITEEDYAVGKGKDEDVWGKFVSGQMDESGTRIERPWIVLVTLVLLLLQ